MYYLQSRYYDPAIGRFINADTFATTDADGFLSCNMFAYCENNPANRLDCGGSIWVNVIIASALITVKDIYCISSGYVSPKLSEDGNVQVKNSYSIFNPVVKLGYSTYLNHFSECKKAIAGTSIGVFYEWELHNIAYRVFNPIAILTGSEKAKQYVVSAKNVDLGKTIYADNGHGKMSIIMKKTYEAIFRLPSIVDLFIEKMPSNPPASNQRSTPKASQSGYNRNVYRREIM